MYFTTYFAAIMYAITGGPSSGKSTIIKELERRGEVVLHEAATDFIADKVNLGVQQPWLEESFELDILKLQLEREQPHLSLDHRVFVDRGLFDCYAYVMALGLAETETLAQINQLLHPIDINRHYRAVFFILPHTANFSSEQTEIRRENTQEAAKLEAAVHALYCRHNNFILVPGERTPQERADFILEKIRQLDEAAAK